MEAAGEFVVFLPMALVMHFLIAQMAAGSVRAFSGFGSVHISFRSFHGPATVSTARLTAVLTSCTL